MPNIGYICYNTLRVNAVTGKELVKRHVKSGWRIDRIHGSHHIIEKDNVTVPIPVHAGKDLPVGTVKAILKITGLKI